MGTSKLKFKASTMSAWSARQEERRREDDAVRMSIINKLGIWRDCTLPRCRRNRACGAPQACHSRNLASSAGEENHGLRAVQALLREMQP